MDVLQDWMINIQDYVRFNSDIASAAIDWSRLTVRDYVTETGVQIKIMAGHLFVLEFDQELAHQVNIYRLILSDLVRFYTICLYYRFTIQWFAINPFDGGLAEVLYMITTPYVRFFIGYLPSLLGVDIGHILCYLSLEFLDKFIKSILIIDHNGLVAGAEF